MNTLMKGLVATAAMGFAATAAAFPVDLENVTGAWGSPTGGSNIQGVGTDNLRWGEGLVTCSGILWWKECSQGPQSGYGFEGATNLPETISSSDPLVLGSFTHFNNRITGDSAPAVDPNAYAPVATPPDNGTVTGPDTFLFSHTDTPHVDCGPLSFVVGCSTTDVDDIVRLDNMIASSQFQFGSSI